MRRINIKLLLLLVAGVVVAGAGVVLLNRFQVARNAGGLVTLARQRVEAGKTAEAAGLFSRYLGMRPNDAAVAAEYAELLLAQADDQDAPRAAKEQAYRALERAVRLGPDNDALRRKLAEFELQIGLFGDAREHLVTLRERFTDPDDLAELKLLEAKAAAGSGDFTEAARLAAELIGFDMTKRLFLEGAVPTGSTEAYALLAEILRSRLNAPADAKAVLDRLVERRGDESSAWLLLSRWHRDAGDMDASGEAVRTAQQLAPDDIDVVFSAFELALARNDLDAAETLATRARELFPDDERSYRGLATVKLKQGAVAVAEEILQEGTARLPTKGSLLVMLADVQLQTGKLAEVDATIARLGEVYGPLSPALGLFEGRVLMAREQWAQARRRLEEVRPLSVGLSALAKQIDLCLALCAEKLGDHDQQLAVTQRILVEDPTSLAARVGEATALNSGGRSREALAAYDALATSVGPERLATLPQIWYPLLQLRIQETVLQPVATRDWSRVEGLLGTLESSPEVSNTQLALLRADVLAQKGEAEAAIAVLEGILATDPATPQPWQALATVVLRSRGADAVQELFKRIPPAVAATPGLMLIEARAAAAQAARSGDGPAAVSEALATFEDRAGELPTAEADQLLRGLAALRLEGGDTAGATRLWETIAARAPTDLPARVALLEIALAGSDIEDMRSAAAAVAEVAGADSGRAKLAQAWVRILDAKRGLTDSDDEGETTALTDVQQALLTEARGLLTEAENDRPGWADVQLALAEIETLQQNLPEAVERLQRAVELAPNDRRTASRLAALLLSMNRVNDARAVIERLPGKAGFERLRAELALREGDATQAAKLARDSVPSESQAAAEWLWLGRMLNRCGDIPGAGEALRRATEVGPQRPATWLALVAHLLTDGQPRAAEEQLRRGVEAVPASRRQLLLAQGSEMLGRMDDADAAFQAAVEAAPDNLELVATRAAFLMRRGLVDQARAELEQIIERNATPSAGPTVAWARRTLAEILAERGTFKDLEAALDLLKANAASDGSLPPVDAEFALRMLMRRPEPTSWRRGIDLLDSLADAQPLTAGQRLTRVQLLDQCGRWDEARNELIAIVANPNTPPPFLALLVEKLIAHGEIETARDWFARLAEAAPDADATLAAEARLAVADNDRDRAATLVRRLVPRQDVPADRAARLGPVANLLEDLGFEDDADVTLRRFADVSPDGTVARAAFLGRRERCDEALDLLEASQDRIAPERLLTTALEVLRSGQPSSAQYERVAGWIERAEREEPGAVMHAIIRAELLGLEGREKEAEQIYRTLAARDDLDPTQAAIVANNLAFRLATPATTNEALELIESAMETLGPHPDLLDTRGVIRLVAGDTEAALVDLEEAALAPTAMKLLHLAYARLLGGNLVAAREALERSRQKGLANERLVASDAAMLAELEQRLQPQSAQTSSPNTAPTNR